MSCRTFAQLSLRGDLQCVAHVPAAQGGMVDGYAAFGQNFLKVTIGECIAHIKEDRMQDDTLGKCTPLKSTAICYLFTELHTQREAFLSRNENFATETADVTLPKRPTNRYPELLFWDPCTKTMRIAC